MKRLSSAVALFLAAALLHAPAFDANRVLGKDGPGALLGHAGLKAQQHAVFTGGAWAADCGGPGRFWAGVRRRPDFAFCRFDFVGCGFLGG